MSDDMLKRLMGRLTDAQKKREGLLEARKAIVDVAAQEQRASDALTEDEDKEFRDYSTQIKTVDEEIASLAERITELTDEETRSKDTADAARRAASANAMLRVTEARTYERGSQVSYLKDLANAQIQGDYEARERLNRHAQEVAVEPEYKEYRDLNRTDGSGGAFVPPAWLMGQWIELARAGRPTANLFNSQPLPPGTDSINIPKVADRYRDRGPAGGQRPGAGNRHDGHLARHPGSHRGRPAGRRHPAPRPVADQLRRARLPGPARRLRDEGQPAGARRDRRVRSGHRPGHPGRRHRGHPHGHDRRRVLRRDRQRRPDDLHGALRGAERDRHAPPPLGVAAVAGGLLEPAARRAGRAGSEQRHRHLRWRGHAAGRRHHPGPQRGHRPVDPDQHRRRHQPGHGLHPHARTTSCSTSRASAPASCRRPSRAP